MTQIRVPKWYAESANVRVVEATEKVKRQLAKESYIFETIVLNREQVQALLEGKAIVIVDEEHVGNEMIVLDEFVTLT